MSIKQFAAKIPILGKRKSQFAQQIVKENPVTKKPKLDSDPNMNPEGVAAVQNIVAMPVTNVV